MIVGKWNEVKINNLKFMLLILSCSHTYFVVSHEIIHYLPTTK